jgi:formylmethanofuran dehydrogenase subunit B
MGPAWIDGNPVALDVAATEAARLLGASRLPVIAGLGTDLAGARAALALARLLRGAIDHMYSDALLRDLDVMREAGMMVTTPSEARLRGDVLLLVGEGLVAAWPQLAERLLTAPLAAEIADVKRRICWLCPGRGETRAVVGVDVQTLGRASADLPALIAALRARVAGRPISGSAVPVRTVDALATELRAARFGVAVWSAAQLDTLTIEMLCGLVEDLNAETRFTGLPLSPGDNGRGVMAACGWTIGYPMRTGFGRGHAEHDPWRFDATRLVESGEADCALWISAYRDAEPAWRRAVPTIALTGPGARVARRTRVHIAVGCPGIDHDAVEQLAATGTLGCVPAAKPSGALSVAQAIAQIAAALPKVGARPC